MKIKRERYVLMRNDKTEIFCNDNNYRSIYDTSKMKSKINTYASEKVAELFNKNNDDIVKVEEILDTNKGVEISEDVVISLIAKLNNIIKQNKLSIFYTNSLESVIALLKALQKEGRIELK